MSQNKLYPNDHGGNVIFTNDIPQCPYCNTGTLRDKVGYGMKTLAYYEPKYDKNGININPDRNLFSQEYYCHSCQDYYFIKGNDVDGYNYYGSNNDKKARAKHEAYLKSDKHLKYIEQCKNEEKIKQKQQEFNNMIRNIKKAISVSVIASMIGWYSFR